MSIDPKETSKETSSSDASPSDPSSWRDEDSPADDLLDLGLRALFDEERQRASERGESDPIRRGDASSSSSKRFPRTEGKRATGPGAIGGELSRSIGRFRILGEIARGGVGIVLQGRDDAIGRDVAVKVLLGSHASHSGMQERLIAEAQIAGQLEHPGIVAVHEMGYDVDGSPFLVMRLVRGRTLTDLLRERPSHDHDRQRFLAIFARIAEAMAHAHSRGVIHRDLKPLNIMVGAFGEVQVMDWGLAKVVDVGGDIGPSPLTSPALVSVEESKHESAAGELVRTIRSSGDSDRSLSGSVLGTPAYMAPEQARGEIERIGPSTDVFGLGAILCEILTGEPPYRGDDARDVTRRARSADLDDARARLRASGADVDLISLAISCLEPEATARPSNAARVSETMTLYLHSLEERAREARLEAAEARVRAAGERKARRLTAVIGILATATVLGGAITYFSIEASRRARIASTERLVRQSIEEAEVLGQGAAAADVGALDAALRAVSAASQLVEERREEITPELAERVRSLAGSLEARSDVARLLHELEHVRQREGLGAFMRLDTEDAERRSGYAAYFAEHLGADWNEIDVAEAARRIVATGRAEELCRYLLIQAARDRRRASSDEGARTWTRPLEIAQLADPDPLRFRLRKALIEGDVDILREVAASDELESASALTLHALAVVGSDAFETSEERIAIWRRACELRPSDFWITSGFGVVLRDARPPQLDEARTWLTVAVSLRPESGLARAMLASVELRLGDREGARKQLREALDLEPGSEVALNGLGVLLERSSDYAGAEEAFRRALEARPRSKSFRATILSNLGNMLFLQGDTDGARAAYEEALALSPSAPTASNGLGWLLYQGGWRREALEHYRRATSQPAAGPASWKNLGEALLEEGDFDGAVRALERAVELDERYSLAFDLLGTARRRRGDLTEAIGAFARSIELAPEGRYSPERLLELFETEGARIDAKTREIEHLGETLEALRRRGELTTVPLALAYVHLWCVRPDPAQREAAVSMAETVARELRGSDASALGALARVRFLCGETREAVRLAEAAVRRAPSRAWWRRDLERYRQAALPDLPTFATIDAVVAELGASLDSEASRARIEAFRSIASGDDAAARLAYLDAHVLARAGEREAAIAKLENLVRSGPWPPEPYLALWTILEEAGSLDDALARFHAVLSSATLPPRPLPIVPIAPQLRVESGPTRAGALRLRTSGFRGVDPRVVHAATRWRVWVDGSDPELAPALDRVDHGATEELDLPAGFLLPGLRYRVHAVHIGSHGMPSRASEELVIETGDLEIEPVPFDLTTVLDRDIFAGSNESSKGPHDAFDSRGYRFVWAAGETTLDATVRGLPDDGRILSFHLAGPEDRNALIITANATTEPIRFEIPRGRYAALRFLVAGANGASTLPIRLETSGASEPLRIVVPCPDWFDDPGDGGLDSLSPRPSPVWNGMDRILGTTIERRKDAALFEVFVPLDGTPAIDAIVIEKGALERSSDETRFILFAVTGMRER